MLTRDKNHPIFMKFCTQQHILNWMNVTLRLFQMKSCIGQSPSSTERISCLTSNNIATLKSKLGVTHGH